MEKELLINYLNQGLTTREIGEMIEKENTTVSYWIRKYGLSELLRYKKPQYKDINYFNKIDTKEKAYIVGFLLGDGCISTDNNLECSISLNDIEILEFIQDETGCNIKIDKTVNKTMRRFPNCSIKIGNPTIINDLKKHFGGRLKEERHIPIIKPSLEKYLLLGFFDAEGCVTWGNRKDRNRLWQKISFTSQLRMLEGIQNILLKNDIATKIKPKGTEKCFILEFSDVKRVLKFLDLIYNDESFIVLHRKYNKAHALRLELGEFGEA